jgi:hypothetical protein
MKKSYFTRIAIIFILGVLLFPNLLLSNDNPFKWKIGEELTYKVKWAFIRLGTLKLQICDSLVIDNTLVYHVRLLIDSNPLLFFVNMHNVYNSYLDKDFQLQLFYAEEKIDDVTYRAEYRLDYSDSLIHIDMTDIKDPAKTIKKSVPFQKTILDGTSLIYYARKNAISTKTDTAIAFFESEQGEVVINFKGKKGRIKISALDSSVESYYVDGKMNTIGIAGVSGPFKGWFAVDEQRIPLKVELKVFVGSVKVELEEWKEWEPKY